MDVSGRPADALKEYELAKPIRERLAADNPTVTDYQADLALTCSNIGDQLRAVGRLSDALPELKLRSWQSTKTLSAIIPASRFMQAASCSPTW